MKKSPSLLPVLTLLVLASCEGISFPSFTFSSQGEQSSGESLLPTSTSVATSTSSAMSTVSMSTSLNDEDPTATAWLTPPPVPSNLTLSAGVCEPTSTPRVSQNTPEEYALFFHPTTKVMIDFHITKQNLSLMNQYGNNVADHDRYVNAAMRIDVTPNEGRVISYCYPVVGLRMKGNYSRQDFVNQNGAITNVVNLKVSFATDNPLDGRIPNQRFLDMTRLDLKWNRNFDHTHVRQVFNHKLYGQYLPYVSEATLGGVRILQTGVSSENQDNYLGLYTIIEPMDRRFLVRRFGNTEAASGNLYKVLYSAKGAADLRVEGALTNDRMSAINLGKIGVENNGQNYHPSYDLKTNSSAANFTDMITLIRELNASSNVNDASYRQTIETLVDLPSFLMMEAIAYFIGNPDDYRNNYNNMYIYFHPSDGKAYFIPYDLDRGFGSHGDYDPTANQYGQFGPSLTKVTPFQEALLKDNNQGRLNPLHRLTVFQGGYAGYLQQYREALATIASSPWLAFQQVSAGNYQGMFYSIHQRYRGMYYPTNGQYQWLQPTGPAIRNLFVPFSINQNAMLNMTFHDYLTAKLNTYTLAVS